MEIDNTPIHETVSEITNLLKKKGVWFDYLEHDPVRTSEEAAKIRPDKYTLTQGAKALIVRVKKSTNNKYFSMLVIPGDAKFDIKKVKQVLEAKDIRFATEEEVLKATSGVKPGGVPPFGNLFNLAVYVDQKVLDNDVIIFNAGDKRISVAIKTTDYQKLVNPTVVAIT